MDLQEWGTPNEDLFPTRRNTQLRVFVSPYPDEEARATDALSIPWINMAAYLFPPFCLLPTAECLGQTVRDCRIVHLNRPLVADSCMVSRSGRISNCTTTSSPLPNGPVDITQGTDSTPQTPNTQPSRMDS